MKFVESVVNEFAFLVTMEGYECTAAECNRVAFESPRVILTVTQDFRDRSLFCRLTLVGGSETVSVEDLVLENRGDVAFEAFPVIGMSASRVRTVPHVFREILETYGLSLVRGDETAFQELHAPILKEHVRPSHAAELSGEVKFKSPKQWIAGSLV